VDIAGWPVPANVASLWGRSPSDVWGAGEDVAHFDGSSWTRVTDAPAAARDASSAHRDSVVTGDATATWLTGIGPTFFRRAP
jgi:hypothetical protein